MISLATAENALKDAYLEAVTNQLNTKTNPLYSKIKHQVLMFMVSQLLKWHLLV